jgi:hypothetical protein
MSFAPGAPAGAPLRWGLAVTTYQRADMLARCVALALAQTRPPSEIVIVDSSPDAGESARRIAALIGERAPSLRLVYDVSTVPNQPAKRNVAVGLATADILFMIDDDSLMYPTCAERVMEVYERPGAQSVVAVMPNLHPTPPDRAPVASEPQEPPSRLIGLAARASETLKGPFFPDFVERADFPTPELGPGARRVWDLHGARITARRSAVLARPFDGALLLNSHEDRDAAFGLSAVGVLVELSERLLCHAEAPRPGGGARRGFLSRGAWLLNYAYLMRKWCPDHPDAAVRQIRRFARGMLVLDAVNAARTRSIGRLRGVVFTERRLLPELLRADHADLAAALRDASQKLEAEATRLAREEG